METTKLVKIFAQMFRAMWLEWVDKSTRPWLKKKQILTFDYCFSILLGDRLFAHTHNFLRMLQGKGMSAAINMRLAKQTIETLKRVLDDSVLQKKKCSPKV